jgi:hypothetical protein
LPIEIQFSISAWAIRREVRSGPGKGLVEIRGIPVFAEKHAKDGHVELGAEQGWHSLKQTLEDNKVNPVHIQRLMRHSSYTITKDYGSGVNMDLLRETQEIAVEAMQPKPVVVKRKRQWA